jgi:biotin operon repressor/predicted phosphodiesterase
MTDEKQTLAALKKAGWNQTHAALELGISRSTLKDRVSRLRQRGHSVPSYRKLPEVTKINVTDALKGQLKQERTKAARLEAQLTVARSTAPLNRVVPSKRKTEREDRVVVVFPDVHGASADPGAVAAFLGDLKSIDPDIVVGLGDLVDAGGFLAQHHVMNFVAETSYSYEDDLKAAGVFLDSVQSAAPRAQLHAIEGNHCARPERWAVTQSLRQQGDAEFLRRLVAPQEILGFAKRGIKYYRRSEVYDGCSVQGAFRIGKITFAHGLLNGGNAPARVLERFGSNVVYGHTHQMASHVKRTPDGPIGAWNLGTLAKLQPYYAHSSPTLWSHGYGVFVLAKSGAFQAIPVTIVNGVSMLPEMKFR